MSAASTFLIVASDSRRRYTAAAVWVHLLYVLLLPYAQHCIVVGPAILCIGSAARFLGLLAMTMGRWEEARSHFETALRVNARLGALPLVALTQHMYALMLLACGQPGDGERAADFLGQALATARELGMSRLEERIQSAVQSLQSEVQGPKSKVRRPQAVSEKPVFFLLWLRTPNSDPSAPSPQSLTPAVFRQEDDCWVIAYQGPPVRLKDVRGFHYIALLLRHPRQECHVLDLVAVAAKGLPSSSSENPDGAHTGRARVNVTNGIRVSLAKITEHNPDLAHYLSSTSTTGLFCSYTPDPCFPITWRF